jgi:hypothetical protein
MCGATAVPRYYFHLVSEHHTDRDDTGVQLSELSEAHAYAVKLQHQIRQYARELKCDLMVRVADESGATPLVILPPRIA